MNELKRRYQALVSQGELTEDKLQLAVIERLQDVFDELKKRQSFVSRIFFRFRPVKGFYFWGGVGIGKTFLMDLFFAALPTKRKLRLHFHQFMQQVQSQLQQLQGHKNPLIEVAKHFANQTQVLCFDEFFVSDIADAMILELLFESLFKRGVCLVATSNIPPDKLYWKGLHRRRFLPAIELIKAHCDVYFLESEEDYRLRELQRAGVYFHPLTSENEEKMQLCFERYASEQIEENAVIEIESRKIQTIKKAGRAVWFDFKVICHTPRSQIDYLDIADDYDVVLVSHVPVIDARDLATVTYLTHLVDVFYDKKVKLILSAESLPDKLYPQGDKVFEFQRTISRLEEMRSSSYFLLKRR